MSDSPAVVYNPERLKARALRLSKEYLNPRLAADYASQGHRPHDVSEPRWRGILIYLHKNGLLKPDATH
jgi:hypothetical protein